MTISREDGRLVPSPEALRALRILGWLFAVFAVGLIVFDADLLTRNHVNTGVMLSQLFLAVGMVGIGGSFVAVRPAPGGFAYRVRQQPVTYKLAVGVAFLSFVAAVVIGAVALSRLH